MPDQDRQPPRPPSARDNPPPEGFLARLRSARSILLITHSNPDGDAIGSASAMAQALMALGKTVAIHLPGQLQPVLNFALASVPAPLPILDTLAPYDLVFILDCHLISRTGTTAEFLGPALKAPDAPELLIMDHHQPEEGLVPVPYWYHLPGASSAGEMAARTIEALGVPRNPELAQTLLLALVSDTGFFTFANVAPDTLRLAADLAADGASVWDLHRRLSYNRSPRQLDLLGRTLATLTYHMDGQVAVMTVTGEMFAATGTGIEDTEGFVEYPRSVMGVEVAAFIRPLAQGGYKVSLRTHGGVDAAALCQAQGGGGHRQAAAYDALGLTAEEARDGLLAVLPKFMPGTTRP